MCSQWHAPLPPASLSPPRSHDTSTERQCQTAAAANRWARAKEMGGRCVTLYGRLLGSRIGRRFSSRTLRLQLFNLLHLVALGLEDFLQLGRVLVPINLHPNANLLVGRRPFPLLRERLGRYLVGLRRVGILLESRLAICECGADETELQQRLRALRKRERRRHTRQGFAVGGDSRCPVAIGSRLGCLTFGLHGSVLTHLTHIGCRPGRLVLDDSQIEVVNRLIDHLDNLHVILGVAKASTVVWIHVRARHNKRRHAFRAR
mmetsp:Transcript_15633/g.35007  ORF Transcript_15633/g.35007 Transcript_15633/m.35007 type:complete len:261 (-) Transcript_15633:272-1054(-)